MADAGIAEWIGMGFLVGFFVIFFFLWFDWADVVKFMERIRRSRRDKQRDEGY